MEQVGGPSRLSSITAKSVSPTRSRVGVPATIKTVITEPPWARDEPDSPTNSVHQLQHQQHEPGSRPASSVDVRSMASSNRQDAEHRWFPFTRRRNDGLLRPHSASFSTVEGGPSHPRETRESSSSGRGTILTPLIESGNSPAAANSPSERQPGTGRLRSWGLHLNMPQPAPSTIAQSKTPGWDSPWMAKPLEDGGIPGAATGAGHSVHTGNEVKAEDLTGWAAFKKRTRRFLLNNVYVPLLFRIVNIGLTTAALGIAIRLRIIEERDTTVGVLGASPTLVVIFAPLTLVHVMIAIYLEYLGRPLGLWRTSAKLAHTLVEVVFICLWSGSLALCLNDYFLYFIPCTAQSSLEKDATKHVPCGHQLILTCLVAIGLGMYCFNLIISLFRIFEKVKVHNKSHFSSGWGPSSWGRVGAHLP
ncbi:hypothetical protein PENSPDRAFT_71365 [Peniophora sp. CONT]|nr:hypothetical protein PENSPDRAFT_71365 [Peniophora sp. CONT]